MRTKLLFAACLGLLACGPQPFISARYVTALAADDSRIYWVDDTSVYSAPIAGGAARRLATLEFAGSQIGLMTDAVIVEGFHAGTGQLLAVPKSGGAPVTLVADGFEQWANNSSQVYYVRNETLFAISPNGGAPTQLYSASFDGLAADDSAIYWGLSSSANQLYKMPIAGGTPQLLGTYEFGSLPSPDSMDDTSFYFQDYDSTTNAWAIMAVSKADGSVSTRGKAIGAWYSVELSAAAGAPLILLERDRVYDPKSYNDAFTETDVLARIDAGQGNAVEPIMRVPTLVDRVIARGGFVYWSQSDGIHRAPIGG